MHRHKNKIAVYGICEFKEKAKPNAKNKSKKNEKRQAGAKKMETQNNILENTRKGMQISL
jgi:hypothetical protein